MSLNDLRLSSSLIAMLYPNSLTNSDIDDVVVMSNKTVAEQKIAAANTEALKWLGNNQKNILIVVHYIDVVHLPDDELNFLTGMLTACKLSLDDVAIINTNNFKNASYKDFLMQFKSRTVFLFGVTPADFGLPANFPAFQVQLVSGCTYLYTPALQHRSTDSLFKSRLWLSLRSIFSI
jgi:hypothetical protein